MGQYRTLNGWGNNLSHPEWGQAGTNVSRPPSGAHYADGLGAMIDRGNPRAISNAVSAQAKPVGNALKLSSMFWQWGQFIDHDFALIDTNPGEPAPIAVPAGDPFFDPLNTGAVTIAFSRSEHTDGVSSAREHANAITHWIDGSMVYGSDDTRCGVLREWTGGRLSMSAGDMLMFNTAGMPNAPTTGPEFFLAGDVRANEQAGLTAMHTFFNREHNYWADRLAADNPGWTDEQLFQKARKIVGAEVQAITYNQWLPRLLGGHGPGSYAGYDDSVDPAVNTAFSTAAFRIGHTMLNDQLLRLNEDGTTFAGGHLELAQAFFNPAIVQEPGSLDAIVRGLAKQEANEIDTQVVDAVRNFLFGPPGAGGMDLVSLNIQRGRDHGLSDYNTLREDFGLARVATFGEITGDAPLAAMLEATYGSVDNIDAFIGLLAEEHLGGAAVGPTMAAILTDQFERFRDADRFFYLADPELLADPALLAEIDGVTLGDIILRTTGIVALQGDVFVTPAPATAVLSVAGVVLLGRRRR